MLEQYRLRIEAEMQQMIASFGPKTQLRDACEYALMSGGKRIRPTFVLMIANALGCGLDAMPAALSVEFFHTASLIADDLPCMDNDDFRRERPSLHRCFPEGIALLASYTLIAAGYEGIYKNGLGRPPQATILSLEIATRCAGIWGATNGQFLDLFPPDKTLATAEKIIRQKTVTLFQIAFVFGWLFGGGAAERLPEVEQAAAHLGLAFQLGDDIQDGNNMVDIVGEETAFTWFQREMQQFETAMRNLSLWNEEFAGAAQLLQQLAATR